jgi:hypothetical protein
MIEYTFVLNDGHARTIVVDPERSGASHAAADVANAPPWTLLGENKCPHCPLSAAETPVCPPAYDAREVLKLFSDIISCEVIDVRVKTPEREISKRCDVQTALMAVLGLIMASSGCPILAELRAMAVFHLPFSNHTETIYRTTANHLLKQFFAARRGETPDYKLDKLRKLYADLEELNHAFFGRIKAAAKEDANLNAVTHLLAMSMLVTASMDEGLVELESFFPAPVRR